MFGPVEHAENRSLIDLGLREKAVMLAMVVPIFWIGIYPDPFLRRIEPSVIELLRQIEERSGAVVETAEEPAPEAVLEPPGEAAATTAPPHAMEPEEAPAPASAAEGEEKP
jgi:NADH-quinone oxidoreductase subunit M